jgi:hypothetical protein
LKMELIQGSETSANYNSMPGKYPKEHTQYSNHGESLKSRIVVTVYQVAQCHIAEDCSLNIHQCNNESGKLNFAYITT